MSVFMRLRKILNWVLLCVNILLCAILSRTWFSSYDNQVTQTTKVAAEMGMDVYCVKGPFAIYIDKQFYENGSYYICQYGDPFIYFKVKGNIENNNNLMKNALFGIGKDIAVSWDYSIGNEGQVQEIRLLKNDESFSDLNADGKFNTHIVLWPKEKMRLDVWYKGKWQEAEREKSEGIIPQFRGRNT
jgi:hypothetical protein